MRNIIKAIKAAIWKKETPITYRAANGGIWSAFPDDTCYIDDEFGAGWMVADYQAIKRLARISGQL